MDALTGLLSGPRARNAFLLRSVLDPPWAIRIEDEAPLTVVALLAGEAWLVRDGQLALGAGDVLLVQGPDHYVVADSPATPPQVVIPPGQRCTTVDGTDLYQAMDLGVRTWGNSPTGGTRMLTGTYHLDTEVSRRLLDALPPVVHLPGTEWDSPLIAMLATEAGDDAPGQEVFLDRLLDLLLMAAVRAWFARPGSDAPAWYSAERDPAIGSALRMLHNNPAHGWTVAELAADAGMSRAAFARRFAEVVGEPPMTYLTSWRLTLAADLLCEPGTTIAAVAREVGYASPYALSAAFKRVRGLSPKEHRLARTERGKAARHPPPRDTTQPQRYSS